MTFDDWVKDILKIEAREITHPAPEEQKKVCFTVSADDLIKLWNAGVENGVNGMQLKITELEAQIEKMKMCCNCNRWRNSGDTFNYDNNDYPCYAHDCDDKCKLWELIK